MKRIPAVRGKDLKALKNKRLSELSATCKLGCNCDTEVKEVAKVVEEPVEVPKAVKPKKKTSKAKKSVKKDGSTKKTI